MTGLTFKNRLPKTLKSLVVYAVYCRIIIKTVLLVILRRPYKLTLLLSGGCNLRCRLCTFWQKKNVTISVKEVAEIWASFRFKPCWFNISGGEPTINPELEQILRFFTGKKRALFITFTSNGIRDCTPIMESALCNCSRKLLYVSLSLDGDAGDHNAARAVPGAWEKTYRTFRNLSGLRSRFPALTVGVSITISAFNYQRIIPFFKRIHRETRAVNINLAQSSDYYDNDPASTIWHLPKDALVAVLEEIRGDLADLGFSAILKTLFLDLAIRRLHGERIQMRCASYSSNVLITADLDLVDCIPIFKPWVENATTREGRLEATCDAIRAPRTRLRMLRAAIVSTGCEARCLTPCETYVHLISALLSPRRAPGLLYRFFCIYLDGRRGKRSAWRVPEGDAVCSQPPE